MEDNIIKLARHRKGNCDCIMCRVDKVKSMDELRDLAKELCYKIHLYMGKVSKVLNELDDVMDNSTICYVGNREEMPVDYHQLAGVASSLRELVA